jgi:pyruvate dehydrogenase E2 component (dihydrolipoamide acetyltransferase)
MATSVIMPALEMAQETGKLVKWYKREGETVTKGELLLAIETDKAVIELEAEASGILGAVRAQEGDVVNVGTVIAWLLAPGETAPTDVVQTISGRQATWPQAQTQAGVAAAGAQKPAVTGERALLSPKARRLAEERGVDVSAVRGSGPGGAVVADDLEASVPSSEDPGQIWRIMADRVTASWTSVPHFFLTRDVDATGLSAARASLAQQGPTEAGESVTYTDQLVALVARVLRKHPRLNASWVDRTIQYHDEINIGIATVVERGLVVPVIHGADRLSIHDIAKRRREVVARAKAHRLQPADLAQGTITISNLGMFGIDSFSAIVSAPQAAILAVGRIADRVVAQEGCAVVCPRMTLTLSCDHRVVDGARGAEFLRDLAAAIEHPDRAS